MPSREWTCPNVIRPKVQACEHAYATSHIRQIYKKQDLWQVLRFSIEIDGVSDLNDRRAVVVIVKLAEWLAPSCSTCRRQAARQLWKRSARIQISSRRAALWQAAMVLAGGSSFGSSTRRTPQSPLFSVGCWFLTTSFITLKCSSRGTQIMDGR